MLSFKQLCEEREDPDRFPEYYKAPKTATIKQIADRYFKTGDKLRDVDWVGKGEYHIMASIRELDKYKEHNWSRFKSRRGDAKWEELVQSIKKEGIKTPVQVFLYEDEKRIRLGEGNHRLGVAKELGIKKIPVVFFFYKGDKDKQAKVDYSKFEKELADQDKEFDALLQKLLGEIDDE